MYKKFPYLQFEQNLFTLGNPWEFGKQKYIEGRET